VKLDIYLMVKYNLIQAFAALLVEIFVVNAISIQKSAQNVYKDIKLLREIVFNVQKIYALAVK
jgi:hypothetical protein